MDNTMLDIKEVKEIFIRSNFFDWLKEEKFDIFYNEENDYESCLKNNFFCKIIFKYNDEIKTIIPMDFLHGRCCEFAIALSKKYGYRIGLNFDYDDEGNFLRLIHAYCIVNNKNNTELIDVRGIQSNYSSSNCFIDESEFEYDWDYNTDIELNLNEAIEFLCKNLNLNKDVYDNLNEANFIIDTFDEKYNINYIKK